MPKKTTVKDILNQTFGKLTVIERDWSRTGGSAYWICRCECGNTRIAKGTDLRSGLITSCGCETKAKQRAKIDTTSLLNKQFGKLKVIERDLTKPIGHSQPSYWVCECECGNVISVMHSSLTRGTTQSCGCLRRQILTEKNSKDLIGYVCNLLTVIEKTDRQNAKGDYYWKCKCECGKLCEFPTSTLTAKAAASCGCSSKSRGEIKIRQILQENNVNFSEEYCFSNLISEKGHPLRFDFAIFNEQHQLIQLIEFDGEQHFKDKEFFRDNLSDRQARDELKNSYVKEHNIVLTRIPYTLINQLTYDLLMDDKYKV